MRSPPVRQGYVDHYPAWGGGMHTGLDGLSFPFT
jgi:hypothetical protein